MFPSYYATEGFMGRRLRPPYDGYLCGLFRRARSALLRPNVSGLARTLEFQLMPIPGSRWEQFQIHSEGLRLTSAEVVVC